MNNMQVFPKKPQTSNTFIHSLKVNIRSKAHQKGSPLTLTYMPYAACYLLEIWSHLLFKPNSPLPNGNKERENYNM